jgi:hypothetical protein
MWESGFVNPCMYLLVRKGCSWILSSDDRELNCCSSSQNEDIPSKRIRLETSRTAVQVFEASVFPTGVFKASLHKPTALICLAFYTHSEHFSASHVHLGEKNSEKLTVPNIACAFR